MSTPQTKEAPLIASPEPIPDTPWTRNVGLCAWMIAVAVLLLIPLRIIKGGYLPADDARRHVAKAFTDKPYNQILVCNSYYKTDQSPGWEWLLKMFHRHGGLGREALTNVSVLLGILCIFYAPLPWLRSPEAWLASLLMVSIAFPSLMMRITLGRPFLVTEGVLIAILFTWPKAGQSGWAKIILATLGITLSVWMHGTWYLWVLPIMAFGLAGAWALAMRLTACIMVGTILGVMMTGHPVEYLVQQVMQVVAILHDPAPQRMLVGEFQPGTGDLAMLVLLGGVIAWRWRQTGRPPRLWQDPVFCMVALCWVLGFKGVRFLSDWGIPAALVWLASQFQEILPSLRASGSMKRLALCGIVSVPLFLHATNDLNRRYSSTLDATFLDAADPALKGWFPDDNGIFYSARMEFFYDTFYMNPQGRWRYVLGMEPAMMREDDLKILRQIQEYNYGPKTYQPWVDKMQPADRMVIYSAVQPDLPKLEWHQAGQTVWIGRLPGTTKSPKQTSSG